MSMTVVVTRNAPPRSRGFLRSVMLEISAGVYVSPELSPSVRERIWAVLEAWYQIGSDESVVMVWRTPTSPSHIDCQILGAPPVEIVKVNGIHLSRRSVVEP